MKCQICGTIMQSIYGGSSVHCPKCNPTPMTQIVYHGPVLLPCPRCKMLEAELDLKEADINILVQYIAERGCDYCMCDDTCTQKTGEPENGCANAIRIKIAVWRGEV